MEATRNSNMEDSTESLPHSTTSSWSSWRSWTSYPLALDGTPTVVLYVCIGLLGIIGNGFAIFILASLPEAKKRITNILLINQSALDLFCSLLVSLNSYKSKALGSLHVVMGLDLYCKLIGSGVFLWGLILSSTWNLVSINSERYISVVFPIFHKTSIKRKYLKLMAVTVWCFGPLFTLSLFVPTSGYSSLWNDCAEGTFVPNKAVATFIGLLNLSVQVFIPVGLMTYFYICMFLSIKKDRSSWF